MKTYQCIVCGFIYDEAQGLPAEGIPAGTKWGFCPPGVWPRYIVVNGDESEPGTYKDRVLMERDPHQLIEGIAISSLAGGIGHAFIFIRGEYDKQGDILDEAVAALAPDRVLGAIRGRLTRDRVLKSLDTKARADYDERIRRDAGAEVDQE